MAPTGPTGGTRARLQKLYEHHSRIADGLRLALDALDGDLVARKVASNGTLDAALAIEAERRASKPTRRGPGRPPTRARVTRSVGVAAQRKRSAKLLAKLSEDDPRPSSPLHMAGLIRHGYVKSVGKDDRGRTVYLRTGKVFDVTP